MNHRYLHPEGGIHVAIYISKNKVLAKRAECDGVCARPCSRGPRARGRSLSADTFVQCRRQCGGRAGCVLAERQPEPVSRIGAEPECPVSIRERGNGAVEFFLLLPFALFLILLTAELVLYVISVLLTQGAGDLAARAFSLFDAPRVAVGSFLRQSDGIRVGLDPVGSELVLRRRVWPFFGITIPERLVEEQTSLPVVKRPCAVDDFEDNYIIQGELCV